MSNSFPCGWRPRSVLMPPHPPGSCRQDQPISIRVPDRDSTVIPVGTIGADYGAAAITKRDGSTPDRRGVTQVEHQEILRHRKRNDRVRLTAGELQMPIGVVESANQ